MAQQSVQEVQRNAILRTLQIGGVGDQQSWPWKVLVYDRFCQQVVAPLLKVGGLRNHGVTLHLNLENERPPVPEVAAVYFVEPTAENIKIICEDLAKGLYESCYVNFASAVTRSLLSELAQGALKAGATQKVGGVFDRYVSFVSLAPQLFSLNLPSAYETLNSTSIEEQYLTRYVERIVDGLLSVLVTLRAMPVIRCPPGFIAEAVARRLEERIRQLVARKDNQARELFENTSSGSSSPGVDAVGATRPVLAVLDRDADLVTMLHHTWTYQAMAHDVLGMKLNKLTVPVEDPASDAAAPPKSKSYDVDESDSFWSTHAGNPFPEVAEAVHGSIEEFSKKREEMNKGKDGGEASEMSLISGALNALPEMTEKKRSIDMHTNIATALLNEIKARELDRYYEMEDQFASQSIGTSVKELEQLLEDQQRGTLMDKTRALMCLYLSKPSMPAAQLQGLAESLRAKGGDSTGLAFLQHLASIRTMTCAPAAATAAASSSSSGGSLMGSATSMFGNLGKSASGLGGLADKMRQHGEGLLSAGMNNLKNIVTSKQELAICQTMDGLMEMKGGTAADGYLYLDPKAAPGAEATRQRAPFRRGIAFVVGGGNYAEQQSLHEWAQAHGRHVIYGATDLVSPEAFVEELCRLGQSQQGPVAGGDLR